MAECPHCEYNKKRAQLWRDEAYRLAGHPLPRKETSMTQDEIIEMARQGHASTRDAIRWAMNQEREAWERKFARLQSLMDLRETQPNKPCCLAEREACANLCEQHGYDHYCGNVTDKLAEIIRASKGTSMIEKQETARAWWPGSSLKEYTDALQELSDRLKKESEQGGKHDS